jgi:hypothetical protein
VTLSEELAAINSVFIDTAPIIYYIQAHPEFGPLAREVVMAFQSGDLIAYFLGPNSCRGPDKAHRDQ